MEEFPPAQFFNFCVFRQFLSELQEIYILSLLIFSLFGSVEAVCGKLESFSVVVWLPKMCACSNFRTMMEKFSYCAQQFGFTEFIESGFLDLAGSMFFSILLFIFFFYIVGRIHAVDVLSKLIVSAKTFLASGIKEPPKISKCGIMKQMPF